MSCAAWPPRLTNDEWFARDDSGHESVNELAGNIVPNDAAAAAGTNATAGADTDTNTDTSSAVVAVPTCLIGAGDQSPTKAPLAPCSPPSLLCGNKSTLYPLRPGVPFQ